MAELVKNPGIQDKLHDEIRATNGSAGHISEEDVHMELGGYMTPKGTTVNFMVADIGMDEQAWERPAEFAPERFLPGGDGEGTDITGTREIWPGLNVATLHLEYFVANMVRAFEWRAADGEEVDVNGEKAEFTVVMANPLRARLAPREVSL